MKKIILASTSKSRREQLQRLYVSFTSISPNVNEKSYKNNVSDYAQLSRELSLVKAQKVKYSNKEAIVIGGDTLSVIDDVILSKPKTKEKAFEQLKMLSGKQHRVITSTAILVDDKQFIHTSISKLRMRRLTNEQITRYISIDKPLQSCGSCRLDSLGISLFEEIECEDYTAIIGLPLMWTAKILTDIGVSVP